MDAEKPTVYRVPAFNIDALRIRMAILAKRAEKLGCEAPVLVENGHEDVERTKLDPLDGLAHPTGIFDRYFLCEVRGDAPAYGGWKFVASVDAMPEAGNLVRVVPGETIPVKYRTQTPHCDQCKAVRNRVNHYIVKNAAGECRMIGSSCVKDFLGHQSPENIARMATYWASFDGVMEEACHDRGGFHGVEFLDLVEFLSHVAARIAKSGWLGSSHAREEGRAGEATKALAIDSMFERSIAKRLERELPTPTDADRELAAKSIAWAQTIDVKSDFDHNLRTLAQSEVLPFSGAGVAAAMVFCYKRETEQVTLREMRAKQFATSMFVGEIGKRMDFKLSVVSVRIVDGNYGTTSIHTMVDDSGNRYTWFASSQTLEEGEVYVLKGTVKAHEEYKGTKSTIITRCKIVNKVGEAIVLDTQSVV